MRVLWAHNFPPTQVSSGVFMHQLAESVSRVGVTVDLHYTGCLRNPARAWRAARRLREISSGYDLTHAQFGSACGFVTSFARGPKLLSLRGSDLWGFQNGRLAARAHGVGARSMTRWSLARYDRVLVMSNRMLQVLRDRYGHAGNADVVPDGIDLGRFRPMTRQAARAALGEGDDRRPWVLFSSLFNGNAVKRPALARAAINAAQRSRHDLVLKTMTGVPHEDVPLWLNACNAVLLTSTHEGWPNIIKEALACNVPFVSTDVSDLAAIANVEPSCHISAPNATDLSRALLRSLEQPRPENAAQHVAHMEMQAIAGQLRGVYEELSGSEPVRLAA